MSLKIESQKKCPHHFGHKTVISDIFLQFDTPPAHIIYQKILASYLPQQQNFQERACIFSNLTATPSPFFNPALYVSDQPHNLLHLFYENSSFFPFIYIGNTLPTPVSHFTTQQMIAEDLQKKCYLSQDTYLIHTRGFFISFFTPQKTTESWQDTISYCYHDQTKDIFLLKKQIENILFKSKNNLNNPLILIIHPDADSQTKGHAEIHDAYHLRPEQRFLTYLEFLKTSNNQALLIDCSQLPHITLIQREKS